MYLHIVRLISAVVIAVGATASVFAQNSGLSAPERSFVFQGETGAKSLSRQRMQEIEGRAAPLVAVVIISQSGRMIVQRWVSTRVAASLARQGKNLWAPTRQSSKSLARQVSQGGNRPIREFSGKYGKGYTHHHANPRIKPAPGKQGGAYILWETKAVWISWHNRCARRRNMGVIYRRSESRL